jgi:hypothetical protein
MIVAGGNGAPTPRLRAQRISHVESPINGRWTMTGRAAELDVPPTAHASDRRAMLDVRCCRPQRSAPCAPRRELAPVVGIDDIDSTGFQIPQQTPLAAR